MNALVEFAIVALLGIGSLFTLVGSYGLARLSEFFKRLHGPTKATTLGVGCILMASMAWHAVLDDGLGMRELLITAFLFLTAPISAHLMARAALAGAAPTHPAPPPMPAHHAHTGDAHAGTSRLAWLALIPLAVFALAVGQSAGGAPAWAWAQPWVPALGVQLALRIDGLSLQFVLMIAGVGTLVAVYAGGYMAGTPRRGRLFALLGVFFVAMLGCVTSDDLVLLFLFWELTSLASFLLVGFQHESDAARRSAHQALMVTAAGGLALLAGVLLLGQAAGTYSISGLLATAPQWREHPLVPAALLCLFAGAFTKSAQVPFHFWLPNAMAAPTPVSAYLHSATMVKLGVYLLARLNPAFDGLALWHDVLVTMGAVTAAWAMVLTLLERDLKRILAWSTVSALGTLVMLIGLPGADAAAATVALLMAHALYKAPLFFVAGNIDHATGTRRIDALAGLASRMPWTAAAAALAALSMAGMPFSLGYVAKELITASKGEAGVYAWVSHFSVFVNVVTIAVASVAAVRVFWHRGGRPVPSRIHEPGWAMRLPPLVIALAGLALGTVPGVLAPLLEASARAIVPELRALPPGLGFDDVAALRALAVAAAFGMGVYLAWDRLHRVLDRVLRRLEPLSALTWYGRALDAVPALGAYATRRLQGGRLRGYTLTSLAFMAAAVGAALALAPPAPLAWSGPGDPAVAAAAALVVAACIAACRIGDAFAMLLASGVAGLGSALLFVLLQAPDVALTQLLVEVAFVVVIASILLRLRALAPGPRRDAPVVPRLVVALGVAGVLSWLLLRTGSAPLDPAVADAMSALSVPAAHGHNVVNVVLVDFRAVDTLAEVAVVALALVAALPLLRLAGAGRAVAAAPAPLMLERMSRLLYPLMLAAAVVLLWRGHNAPGGGFIAGMVAVAATALASVARGPDAARAALPLPPLPLAAGGVLLSLASGLPALWTGEPYMTHLWATLPLGVAAPKVSTVLAFDLGVACAVWGAMGGLALRLLALDPEPAR